MGTSGKHFLLEVGKTDVRDFRLEISAVLKVNSTEKLNSWQNSPVRSREILLLGSSEL